MTARATFTQADVARAKKAAEAAGLRLAAFEVKPDGTVKLEFGEFAVNDDWRVGTPFERQV